MAVLTAILAGCGHAPPASDKADAAARQRLARLADAEGNPADELALFAPAAARDPGDLTLQTRYAIALGKAGRNKEALDAALGVYGHDKSDISVALLTARLYVRLDQASDAAGVYKDVLARDPANIQAINGLGIATVISGAYDQAEANFRQAIAASPNDAPSRNNLGLALALQHKTDEAIPLLEALSREDSASARVRTNLALAYTMAGDRAKAVTLLTGAIGAAEAEKTVTEFARLIPAATQASNLPATTVGSTVR